MRDVNLPEYETLFVQFARPSRSQCERTNWFKLGLSATNGDIGLTNLGLISYVNDIREQLSATTPVNISSLKVAQEHAS